MYAWSLIIFFFFKQKTAYEMRISDWSSDVCSSDLAEFQKGKPRLLNIFASWCVPCAAEAPQLAVLKEAGVAIDGIAIRDSREDLDRFLARWGNPYARIGSDVDSSVQIALGSSGVPETFVIDGKGMIVYQHIGAIRKEQDRKSTRLNSSH